jgi:hypothetical protein
MSWSIGLAGLEVGSIESLLNSTLIRAANGLSTLSERREILKF